jgi:hypothetical protein
MNRVIIRRIIRTTTEYIESKLDTVSKDFINFFYLWFDIYFIHSENNNEIRDH